MSSQFLDHDRLSDLLAQRATEGLSQAEHQELLALLAAFPDADGEAFEKTAAALTLAADWPDERLPSDVRKRLDQLAESQFPLLAANALPQSRKEESRPQGERSSDKRLAWFAAAAAVLLAAVAWWPRLEFSQQRDIDLLTQASLDVGTLTDLRERFIAATSPLTRPWANTEDAASQGVTGDIVWDNESQTGYMRFAGLPVNDPEQSQYQLWIFDAARGEQYPVDGGVFNVPAGVTEVVVPILAKLPVSSPALFAVTIERPGGVVVSSRERIVVVAPVSAG